MQVTPTIWFSLGRKRLSHTHNCKKMETFWFLRLRIRRPYDSAYDSVVWLSLDRKRSYPPITTPSLVKTDLMYQLFLLRPSRSFSRVQRTKKKKTGSKNLFGHAYISMESLVLKRPPWQITDMPKYPTDETFSIKDRTPPFLSDKIIDTN